MRWEEMTQDDSDGKLAEIEEDIRQICKLLDKEEI
jgi:hypothetical protein